MTGYNRREFMTITEALDFVEGHGIDTSDFRKKHPPKPKRNWIRLAETNARLFILGRDIENRIITVIMARDRKWFYVEVEQVVAPKDVEEYRRCCSMFDPQPQKRMLVIPEPEKYSGLFHEITMNTARNMLYTRYPHMMR